jgi:hypothetical protein
LDPNKTKRTNELRPDDAHAALERPVAELLRRVPKRWRKFSLDALTEQESEALRLLVMAELVERRCRVRLTMLNQAHAVEATFTATGEYGLVEALQPLILSLWRDWQAGYVAWRESDVEDAPPFHCEGLKPSEWRLSARGDQARQDLAEGRVSDVLDFVLWRRFFDGSPRLLPGGKISQRLPVRGHGQLVKFKKVKVDEPPAPQVANVKEIADAVAEAFVKKYESLLAGLQVPTATAATQEGTDRPATREPPRVRRNLETEDRLQKYLSGRAGDYERLVNAVLRSESGSIRCFREEFGPTAFARKMAEEGSGDEAEINRIKTAVQKTRTYRERIKPVLRSQPPEDWRSGKLDVGAPAKKHIGEQIKRMCGKARGNDAT